MKKLIVGIIIAAVVILGSYSLLNGPTAPPQDSGPGPAAETPSQPEAPAPTTETPAGNVVIYTDAGYSPTPLTIKVGETVTFKNGSSRSMWTASALHPTHREYPTTGGCLGSTFDACMSVQPGDSWSFKFDIPGTWRYHNHLNPSNFGAIIVE